MTIASGVAKQLAYKAESTWGTVPSAASAQALRRVTSNLSLKKATYQSNEIASNYMVSDFRHGVRSIEGSINGELSPGTYKDFMGAALRKAWASVTAISGLSLTMAASGSNYTITRGSGSFLSDGLKVGDVARITAGSVNANSLNKNFLVLALTATVATVYVLNGLTLTAEGPIASCTITVTGKKVYVPTTGHLDQSFSVEHWFSDVSLSEVYSGCKVNTMQIQLPPTGISTIDVGFMGKDITTAASQYFTSPTAASTSGVVAAVNGAVMVNGTKVANITGLSLQIDGGMTAAPVVGSNTYPGVFPGRVQVSGQFTAFFEDATFRDLFINETEVAIAAAFTTASSAASDFIAFSLPRIKAGGASKDDGEKGIVQTIPFVALYNSAGGSGTSSEQSVIVIQDSLA